MDRIVFLFVREMRSFEGGHPTSLGSAPGKVGGPPYVWSTAVEMVMSNDDINRHLKRAMLRIEAQSDQELGAFREEYMGLTKVERTAYRKWVEQHAAFELSPTSIPIYSRALIQVS